jgi:hypothetical protein
MAVEFCRVIARILQGDLEVVNDDFKVTYKLQFVAKIPFRQTVSDCCLIVRCLAKLRRMHYFAVTKVSFSYNEFHQRFVGSTLVQLRQRLLRH